MQIDRDLRHSLAERGGAIRIGGVCVIEKDSAKSALAKLRALLEQAIFAEDLDRWQTKSSLQDLKNGLARAAQRHSGCSISFSMTAFQPLARRQSQRFRQLRPAALAERLFAEDAERFIAKPEWDGQPRETSPLTRNSGPIRWSRA